MHPVRLSDQESLLSPAMSFPDISPEAALPRYVNGSSSRAISMPYRDGHDQVNAAEANHDYTEGATEKEIQEVLKQHKDEEVAHLGESSTGMGDEGPNDGRSTQVSLRSRTAHSRCSVLRNRNHTCDL